MKLRAWERENAGEFGGGRINSDAERIPASSITVQKAVTKKQKGKKYSFFCGILWLIVVRRIKARYHMPPLKGDALE